MSVTNNGSAAVERILLKRDLLRAGDERHQEIRPLLLACGGGMAGVFGGGLMIGLELAGLSHVFDAAVGVSAGAANAAYLLAKQAPLGTSIYYENLARSRFINLFRFGKIMDLDYLENIFRDRKELNVASIKLCRSSFYVAVTRRDGEGMFLSAKDESLDMISAIKASMAVPIAYNRIVKVGYGSYVDGGASNPIPLREAIEAFRPTDILVVLNRPSQLYRTEPGIVSKLIEKMYLRKFSRDFRESFHRYDERYNASLDLLSSPTAFRGINIAVIAPDYYVGRLTRNASVLRQFARHGVEKAYEAFGFENLVPFWQF